MCEVLTKLFLFERPMYDIMYQMSAAPSYGGTDPSGPIFNDSAAQILGEF